MTNRLAHSALRVVGASLAAGALVATVLPSAQAAPAYVQYDSMQSAAGRDGVPYSGPAPILFGQAGNTDEWLAGVNSPAAFLAGLRAEGAENPSIISRSLKVGWETGTEICDLKSLGDSTWTWTPPALYTTWTGNTPAGLLGRIKMIDTGFAPGKKLCAETYTVWKADNQQGTVLFRNKVFSQDPIKAYRPDDVAAQQAAAAAAQRAAVSNAVGAVGALAAAQRTQTTVSNLAQQAQTIANTVQTGVVNPTSVAQAATTIATLQEEARRAADAAALAQAQQDAAAATAAAEAANAAIAAQQELLNAVVLELNTFKTTQGQLASAVGFSPVQAPVAGVRGAASVLGVSMQTVARSSVKAGKKFNVLVNVAPSDLVGVVRVAIVKGQASGNPKVIAKKNVAVVDGQGTTSFKVSAKKMPKGNYTLVTSFVKASADTTGVTALKPLKVK